ncbi:dihydrolipoamide acetyltransferase family protein [Rubrobacter indicoceani]|uniref:dihydrolipoamide acetyltransferase family protein n=1 Tax=Rubrobacter indicoceani TaxID=2051957 RepID=UPI000E5A9078|nr:dihydrolipoamide acetyltransferase family protein [Rubrobacter indicoceani]
MATELTLPTLGMDMTEATIVRWLVSEGESVEKGDPVLEIDTDKTSFEVEAPESGTMSSLHGDEGETLEVGTLLAYVLAPGEEVPAQATPEAEAPEPEASEPEAPEPMAPEPEARNADTSSEPEAPGASANGGVSASGKGLRASPAARRLAAERGVELSEVTGSGPNGRVYLSDVKNFEAAPKETPRETSESDKPGSEPKQARSTFSLSEWAAPAGREVSGTDGTRREALSQVRRIGAERTQRSFSEVPHFYLRRDLDAEGLVALRARLKASMDPAPSLNDLIAFAVGRTLTDHPRLNARFDAGELIINEAVNLGVAAATEKGLLVPVVRGAEKLRLKELAEATKTLLAKARDGKLARDELSGGTFTISNLGMMGVDSFDAIINQPEAAILAVGSLRVVPHWDGEVWIPRSTISVTLSVDHRVADGADGARFLSDLQDGLSNWELLM